MTNSNSSNLIVVKHNCIIEADYRLTVYENRILLTCIAKIDSTKPVKENMIFSISVQDIAELANISPTSAYGKLKESADSLFNRIVTINDPSRYEKPFKTRWAYGVMYFENEGRIELKFAKDILYYLSNLTKNFTQYPLTDVIDFQSTYSMRMYEILKCKGHTGEKIIAVDWIKKRFEIIDKYPRMQNFKTNVIDIAVNEINKKTDMTVDYEPVKKGRNIVAFKFTYTVTQPQKKASLQQQQHSLFLNPPDVIKKSTSKTETTKKQFTSSSSTEYGPKGEFLWGLKRADVERNAKVGEGYEQAAKRIVEERKKANSNAV
jgi:plasmid replication initiation protein